MLSWASLGEPGSLLTVDAAQPKFHVMMGKPGANEKKGDLSCAKVQSRGSHLGAFGRV